MLTNMMLCRKELSNQYLSKYFALLDHIVQNANMWNFSSTKLFYFNLFCNLCKGQAVLQFSKIH